MEEWGEGGADECPGTSSPTLAGRGKGSTQMWGQDQVPCLPSDDISLFKQETQADSRFILPASQAVKKTFVS